MSLARAKVAAQQGIDNKRHTGTHKISKKLAARGTLRKYKGTDYVFKQYGIWHPSSWCFVADSLSFLSEVQKWSHDDNAQHFSPDRPAAAISSNIFKNFLSY
jgi:hypothetical protein